MTLPTSGNIGLSDVLAELRITTPGRGATISLGDADVLALAGKSAQPISLSDLYGKSSYKPMTVTPQDGNSFYNSTNSGGIGSASPSVSVADGSGGYTYAWTFVDNWGGLSFSGATNGSSCIVQKSYLKMSDALYGATLQCVVTDNTGHTVTVQVQAAIEVSSIQ